MVAIKCDLCPFTTSFNYKLKRHQVMHSDLKPWPCTFPGCNYRATQKVHLKHHSLLHETKPELRKPFLCSFEGCGYRAVEKSKVKYARRVKPAGALLAVQNSAGT